MSSPFINQYQSPPITTCPWHCFYCLILGHPMMSGDGRELESEQKLAAYSGEKLEKLDLQLQVFKFRDLCRAAVSTDKYGATLSLLQEAQRGDYAVSCVAAYNLGLKCSEPEHIISLQLLAQTLPLQPACQLVVNAIATSSAGLRHQAAIEFARIFHESPESAECLELACNKALAANFSRSYLAHKLFHHLKKRKFPPRPVPYSGTQICLAHRDPVTVGREHLAKYIDFAKSLPAGWHYKTLTPITQGFDIETHLRREAQEAATKSNMDVSLISKCLTWSMTSSSAGRFVAVAQQNLYWRWGQYRSIEFQCSQCVCTCSPSSKRLSHCKPGISGTFSPICGKE